MVTEHQLTAHVAATDNDRTSGGFRIKYSVIRPCTLASMYRRPPVSANPENIQFVAMNTRRFVFSKSEPKVVAVRWFPSS